MTTTEWKKMMKVLIGGVERELRSSAPTKARVALKGFRKRLAETGQRRRFERDIEAFLQSQAFLRAAAKRYLRKMAQRVILDTIVTLKRAQKVLEKWHRTGTR